MMQRSRRINPVNKKRSKKKFARNFGGRSDAIRSMRCLVHRQADRGADVSSFAGCQGDIQAAHAVPRGMGGCNGDKRKQVPLCHGHHFEAGERGTSKRKAFEARYGFDVLAEAQRIAEQLDGEGVELDGAPY